MSTATRRLPGRPHPHTRADFGWVRAALAAAGKGGHCMKPSRRQRLGALTAARAPHVRRARYRAVFVTLTVGALVGSAQVPMMAASAAPRTTAAVTETVVKPAAKTTMSALRPV